MSESNSEAVPQQPQEGADQAKVFDADYVDKLRKEAARYRTEAKDNADAAKRLGEIQDAQKSETEKVADRIAKADAEVASVPAKVADALRSHLIVLHEIDEDDAELFLTATEPDLLLKQVARLAGRESDRKKKTTNVVPREGQTSSAAENEERAFARELFTG